MERRHSVQKAETDVITPPLDVRCDGNLGGVRHDAAALADFEVVGVEPGIGPFSGELGFRNSPTRLSFAMGIEPWRPHGSFIAELGCRDLGDAAEPHCLREFVVPPGRHVPDPRFLEDGDHGLLGRRTGLEDAREITALRRLRYPQIKCAETGIERAEGSAKP